MAANGVQQQQQNKKMEFAPVDFDIDNIALDAPEGAWTAIIPRGKIVVRPTNEERFPMMIVPIRLEKTEEDGEIYEKALGVELRVMIVFFPDTKAQAARMSKTRLRQLCEATEIDTDKIPKSLRKPLEDLQPLIAELEGKRLPVWTWHGKNKKSGETEVNVSFRPPGAGNSRSKPSDDDDDDKPAARKGASKSARR